MNNSDDFRSNSIDAKQPSDTCDSQYRRTYYHGPQITAPSRRKFLKSGLTGLLSGAAMTTGLASGLLAVPSQARAYSRAINVRDYGAHPNAHPSRNVAAFQEAIDKAASLGEGQVVYVPAGTYKTDNPVYMRDYVTLKGDGASSHIKNIAAKGISTNAIMMGDYHGKSFLEGNFLSVKPAMKYSRRLFFRNPEDAKQFRKGDLIILQSEENWRGDFRPQFQEINEIVSRARGVVELKYPLHDNFEGSNPKVQRSGDPSNMSIRGNVARIVKQARIRDLKISSNGSWMSLGGAFECTLQDLVLDSAAIMNVNGFAHSHMRNIKARYWRRMIHLAYFCHHSVIEDVDAVYREGYPNAPGEGINLGEGSHNNIIRRIQVVSDDPGGYRAAIQLGNCCDNTIYNARFKLKTAPDYYIVEFRGNYTRCCGNSAGKLNVSWKNGRLDDIIRINPPKLFNIQSEQVAGNSAGGYFNGKKLRVTS